MPIRSGFLRVLKQLPSPQRYVVYPKPAGEQRLPTETARSGAIQLAEGSERAMISPAFAHMRGESQRHIDWKAVARGQALMTNSLRPNRTGCSISILRLGSTISKRAFRNSRSG